MSDIHDFKTVGIIGYIKHKKNGWDLSYIEYFMFTKLKRFWSNLEIGNRIVLVVFAIGIVVTVTLFIVDKLYFDK